MARDLANSGQGIRGIMPKPIIIHDNSSNFSKTRFLLRDAWNTTATSGSSNPKRMITPFRAVTNSGDLLSRQNYSCGGTCQSVQSKPGLYGLRGKLGNTTNKCMASVTYSKLQESPEVPSSTCNVKYVYDSSDYIRFVKQQSVNRNYNDRSFGGDEYNSTQSAIKAVRRY